MTEFHKGAAWAALRRKVHPMLAEQVASGNAVCINCGRTIWAGQKWAVGHRLDASLYPEYALDPNNLGPTHHGKGAGRNCNLKAGGKLGAAKTNARKKRREEGEFPNW